MLKFFRGLLQKEMPELPTKEPGDEAIKETPLPEVTHDATSVIEPFEYFEAGGVPIFKPTMEQFQDFSGFIQKIEKYGRKAGIVKIIPPKEWSDSLTSPFEFLESIKVQKPIIQQVTGAGLPAGAYRALNMESRRSYSVQDWFRHCMSDEQREPQYDQVGELRMAALNTRKKRKSSIECDTDIQHYCTHNHYSNEYCEALETFYWKNITYTPPLYGADMMGSIFKDQGGSWNLNRLDNLLQKIPVAVPGVNTPYLYFGMWKATFAWHVVRSSFISHF
jgi:hypothetical protein